jgi:membrane protein implicated in regulation of membrane protease activity
MDWILVAYWVCFMSGLAYAAISALLGGLFGFEHGGIIGGVGGGDFAHDFGTGVDVGGGHGEALAGASPGEAAVSPLSPMTIAVFSTTFGGVGIILHRLFNQPLIVSIPVSLGAAFAVAAVVFVFFYKVFQAVQASSEPEVAMMAGLPAEVTVAIPSGGVGEIAYVVRGGRFTAVARSETGEEIARYSHVRIMRVVGNTYYVVPVEKGPASS